MPGRGVVSSTSYRYGFNGKEDDNEVKGSANSLDFGARIYDPRLGKWLSTDPSQRKYPHKTPYGFASESPISRLDVDGRDDFHFYTVTQSVWIDGPGGPYLKMIGTTTWYTITKNNEKNTYTVHNISTLTDKEGIVDSKMTVQALSGKEAGAEIINYGVDNLNQYQVASDGGPYAAFKPYVYSAAGDVQNLAYLARNNNFEKKVAGIMLGLVTGIASDGLLAETALGTELSFPVKLNSFEDIVNNPNELWGKTADEIQSVLGEGWTKGTYGSNGQGWKFTNGDKSVFYNASSTSHGGAEYYGFSSGDLGKTKIVDEGTYLFREGDKARIIIK